MRYPASEKAEIIELVEQSHLPAKRTLDKLDVPRAIFYPGMIAIVMADLKRWRIIAPDRTASGIASPTMSATRSLTWRWSFPNSRRGSWPCGSPTRESTFSRRLRSIGC
jgi:hypothetical protein